MRFAVRVPAHTLLILAAFSNFCSSADLPAVPTNVAYVSNENGGISVIDLASLQVVRQIPVTGTGPRGIALSPDGRHLVAANKETADVSVIDTALAQEVRRIPIGSNPEFIKLHPLLPWVFTSHEPASTGGPPEERTEEEKQRALSMPPSRIVAVNTETWEITKTITGGIETEGLEFSPDGRRLIVTNEAEDTVAVYDVESEELLHTIDTTPYGLRPRGVKVSPDGTTYAITLEATAGLLLLDSDFKVIRTIAVGSRPYGVGFDRSGQRLFVAAAGAQKLQVFDAQSLELAGEIPVGRRCWHFTFTPDDSKILVACGRSQEIRVIDAAGYATIKVLDGFDLPWGVITYPRSYGSLDLP